MQITVQMQITTQLMHVCLQRETEMIDKEFACIKHTGHKPISNLPRCNAKLNQNQNSIKQTYREMKISIKKVTQLRNKLTN